MTARLVVRLLLAAFFLFDGSIRGRPELYYQVMPTDDPLPFGTFLEATGRFEFLGGIGLLLPWRAWQVVIGWGLVLLLVAMCPANIHITAAHIQIESYPHLAFVPGDVGLHASSSGFPSEPWVGWVYLTFQLLLILPVMWVTAIGPFTKRAFSP